MTRRWSAPIAVLAVVAAVVAVAVVLSRGSSTTKPALLQLASGGAVAASASVENPPPSGPYVLTGTLPAGTPPDAAVWRLPRATADDAAGVARALHVGGDLTRVAGGWVVRIDTNRLAVRDNGTWSLGLDCFGDQPVAQEELTVECATAIASGTAVAVPRSGSSAAPVPAPTPSVAPGPTEDTARATAQGVMHALGYADVAVTVTTGDPTAWVQATPRIDGQPVVNWATSLAVRADGSIASGSGWVGTPTPDDSYPLITAQRAFALLQQQPQPMYELCMRRPDGKPGCADIPPREVTGATPGLTLDYDDAKPVLVPAWLFTVKGQDLPVAQVAVDPAYLTQPTAPPVPKGAPVGPPASVAPAPATP